MNIIFDLATLLGGLAALWFIRDKFAGYSNKRKSYLQNQNAPSSIIYCMVGAILFGVAAGKYGSLALVLSGVAAGILAWIIFLFNDETSWRYESLTFPIIIGLTFLLIWGLFGGGIIIIAETFLFGVGFSGYAFGMVVSIAGLALGAAFGSFEKVRDEVMQILG